MWYNTCWSCCDWAQVLGSCFIHGLSYIIHGRVGAARVVLGRPTDSRSLPSAGKLVCPWARMFNAPPCGDYGLLTFDQWKLTCKFQTHMERKLKNGSNWEFVLQNWRFDLWKTHLADQYYCVRLLAIHMITSFLGKDQVQRRKCGWPHSLLFSRFNSHCPTSRL